MKHGREPTLNVLHLASGSRQFRPNEPKPETPLGDPPEILTGKALDVWNTVTSELKKLRVGSKIDVESLVCYCLACKAVEDAQKDIDKNGMTVCTERGWVKNPACTIQNSAMAQVRQFASEFGLTPVSRARVTTAPPETEASPWAELKKSKAE